VRTQVQSLTLLSGLRISVAVSCGVARRSSLDPALLWLWHKPEARALIQPLAWELASADLKKKKKKKNPKTTTTRAFIRYKVLVEYDL